MNPAIKKLVEAEAPFLALSDDKRKIVCCMNGGSFLRNLSLPLSSSRSHAPSLSLAPRASSLALARTRAPCRPARRARGLCQVRTRSPRSHLLRRVSPRAHRHSTADNNSGKKYKKLKTRKTTEDWADRYKPFLVPSVNFPNMMFCALTNHVIQKKQAVVEEHLKGRKFKTAQGTLLLRSGRWGVAAVVAEHRERERGRGWVMIRKLTIFRD